VHTQHTHIVTCSRTSHVYAHSQTHMYSHADHTRAHVLTGIDGPAKGSASNERVAFLTELELAVGNTASPSVLTAVRNAAHAHRGEARGNDGEGEDMRSASDNGSEWPSFPGDDAYSADTSARARAAAAMGARPGSGGAVRE